ncbi:hypothetical protein PYW08_014540 [Mythimna loreyi]|uniref:Uncharacterized protein n=1 Tax=Mythimna loreyi TaxID=667449 RepID=A0ACC2R4D2_9NEOP|nr:hypothetical protein PYW08_014540 [Mythimna loreyi]
MCRTCHAFLQTLICTCQMLIRIFMVFLMMIENLIRLCLNAVYNFFSLILQLISILPVCLVFILTSKLKCLMCSNSCGTCPVQRNGSCDCIMSIITLIIIYYFIKSYGYDDKILAKLGLKRIQTSKKRTF